MKSSLKIGLVQQSCDSPDQQVNLNRSIQGIREVAAQGAELIVLPELHLGPYFCQTEDCQFFDWAENIPGMTTEILSFLAQELRVVIIGSLFERRAPGLYHNTAVVLDKNGTLAGKYRKMHIPDDPGYYEKFYFTPGDLGFKPIDTSLGKLGILVCWDQWYPEAARLMALAGAELLLYPTAIGWNPDDESDEQERQLEAWITIQRSHAVANGLPVISCNRIGHESDPSHQTRGIVFWGNSFVAGPQGELLYRANEKEDGTILVEIDRRRSEDIRRIWPYLRDRRIDEYHDIVKRYLD
jgi:N-carbamoylputrescine amidase